MKIKQQCEGAWVLGDKVLSNGWMGAGGQGTKPLGWMGAGGQGAEPLGWVGAGALIHWGRCLKQSSCSRPGHCFLSSLPGMHLHASENSSVPESIPQEDPWMSQAVPCSHRAPCGHNGHTQLHIAEPI